jgi:hypothetical protein
VSSPEREDRTQAIVRQWEPWETWEDYRHNFYGDMDKDWKREHALDLYASLLRDLDAFEDALRVIVSEWTHSNRHNLTNAGLNRVAYLGQCACALVYRVPHKECRGGYQLLSEDEKAAADAMAKKYLDKWIAENAEAGTDVGA